MTWRKLEQSERGMWCATEGCWGIPFHRLEVEGVASNYCANCRADIEAVEQLGRDRLSLCDAE